MIYPYECTSCGEEFEVIKSYRHIDDDEHCEICDGIGKRLIAQRQSFSGESDWDNVHYNPALGEVVRSNKHASKLARERGMIEIGDEPVENIHKKFDSERDHKINTRYDEIFDPIEINSERER